jgi:uracil-DNA glycosylase
MYNKKTFADRIIDFYKKLDAGIKLPGGVEIVNPYKDKETIKACIEFYGKYYNDNAVRRVILGINPGRFGAGVTGIPFTDPVRLEKVCGIKNNFDKKPELSSQFVYMLIERMGGPTHFYKHYYFGAVSPLGFVKNGKNHNYYDSEELKKSLKPFIIKTLVEQIALGINTAKCFCMGQGKNYDYLTKLNSRLNLFKEIIPLPHPRWIMQYRRKHLNEFLDDISAILSR